MTTTYRWTLLGELQQMDYSDATPDVSFTWNAHNGSQATMTDTLGTHTYAVRTDGLLESETISTADGAALIDPGWDTYRRRQTLVASYAGAATGQETRHYSTQGRLTYLVSDGRTTEYRYHPSTNRIQKRLSWSGAYPAGLTQVAETVETLDSMNRIWVMTNRRSDAMGAPVFSSHTYSFDTANRRDLAVREDGTRWDYDYNDRSEVTAAKRQLGNGTLLAGMESTYEYDAIGNRTLSISGGGSAVASNGTDDIKRSVSYESNALNQYTKMTQGARSFDVAGRYVYDPAASGSSPQVNGIAPWEQTISSGAGGTQLKHFRTSLTAAASGNTTGNYENVNVSTAAGTVLEYSGLKWVPKTIVQPTYDFDGNLLTDGRWTYTWDAENRLKSMSHSGSVTPYVPGLQVEFRYDGLSRRVEKKVSTFNGSIWIEQLRERTLYDGWNPVGTWRLQPPDAGHSNPWWKLHHHYVWGPDISGTEQGAGGVGGLAMIIGGSGGNWFPCYDGNGNITALVDALPNGALAAQYDYDAFGNPVRMSGSAARLNPFRFSTKFTDDETELVYYGYRYYSPGMARWINRDPIGESGGNHLYMACRNQPVSFIDYLGHRVPGDLDGDCSSGREKWRMNDYNCAQSQIKSNESKNSKTQPRSWRFYLSWIYGVESFGAEDRILRARSGTKEKPTIVDVDISEVDYDQLSSDEALELADRGRAVGEDYKSTLCKQGWFSAETQRMGTTKEIWAIGNVLVKTRIELNVVSQYRKGGGVVKLYEGLIVDRIADEPFDFNRINTFSPWFRSYASNVIARPAGSPSPEFWWPFIKNGARDIANIAGYCGQAVWLLPDHVNVRFTGYRSRLVSGEICCPQGK